MESAVENTINPPAFLQVGLLKQGRYNPRRHFKQEALQELADSIKVQGVLQPILVRPVGDGYEIVAGHRRWTAAKMAHGESYEVPVFIREMTDEEAEAAATNENIIRDGMSPSEEAEAAAKILGNCAGNKDEAAKRLGWTVSTLEKRLALMNCSDAVRQALTEEKILLGHAELLATATKDKQDIVLNKLVGLAKLPSVPEFKAQLQQFSKALTSAIFDKKDCAGCQYNSSNQGALFSEAISDGHCTNASCFDEKTDAELALRSEALKDEYPVIKIVKPGENFSVIRIVAEGKNAVGDEQAKSCRGCANFGAAISNIPGSVGNVYKDQCFDPVCNSKKVAAHIKSQQAPVQEKTNQGEAKAKSGKPAEKSEKPATVVQDSTRVKEYRVKQWRSVMKSELMKQPEKNRSLLIALAVSGHGSWISGSKMSQAFAKVIGEAAPGISAVAQTAQKLHSASKDKLDLLTLAITASIEDQADESKLKGILEFLDAKLETYWQINETYLDLLTKSEIELVADEIGLKAHIGEKFSSLLSSKKPELIKALLATEGFVFNGKVPKNMNL